MFLSFVGSFFRLVVCVITGIAQRTSLPLRAISNVRRVVELLIGAFPRLRLTAGLLVVGSVLRLFQPPAFGAMGGLLGEEYYPLHPIEGLLVLEFYEKSIILSILLRGCSWLNCTGAAFE